MLPFCLKKMHKMNKGKFLKTDLLCRNKSEEMILKFLISLPAPFSDFFVCFCLQCWAFLRERTIWNQMAKNFIQSFDTGFDDGTLVTLEKQRRNSIGKDMFQSRVIYFFFFIYKIPLGWIECRLCCWNFSDFGWLL